MKISNKILLIVCFLCRFPICLCNSDWPANILAGSHLRAQKCDPAKIMAGQSESQAAQPHEM